MTNKTKLHKILRGLTLAVALSALCADGKDTVAAVEPSSDWKSSLNAGVGLTDGNSDTLNAHVGFRAESLTAYDEIFLGTDFFYGEDTGVTTSESLYSFAHYNLLLCERLYLGGLVDFLYDDIAAVDYRINVGPLVGFYLIKNDRTRLALEAGPGYQWEDVGGVKADYLTVRFAERFTHQLTETLSLFQSVSFTTEAEDFDNYYIVADAGIETRLSDRWSLRIYAQDRYDPLPAAGQEKNDFGLFTGLSIALGPVAPMPASTGPKGVINSPAVAGNPWEVSLGVAGSLTDGNSDTLGVAADLAATYLGEYSEIFLAVGGAYGESNGVVNRELAYASGQYNKLLSERFYLGGRADFLYDAISELDYRVTPAILAGIYLIKNEVVTLALEAGPSYTFEDQSGVQSDYFGVYVGERFTLQVSENLEFWQSAGAVLDVDNTDNIVIDAQAGFDVKLSGRVSLRTAVRNVYDGDVPAGVEKNDFQLLSGLAISF